MGVSLPKLVAKLASLNMTIEDIDGIIVTHEHQDHTRGLKRVQEKHKTKLFCNLATAEEIHDMYDYEFYFHIFSPDEMFYIGDIEVTPFNIPHDAAHPVGFSLRLNGKKIGFCTDCGHVTSSIISNLKNADILVVEANYSDELIGHSKRPEHNKQRVKGRFGHLSNNQCLDLLNKVYHPKLQHIYLAHMSGDCNTHEEIEKQ